MATPINPLKFDAVKDRPIMLSIDLIHFLCKENHINWLPIGHEFYCPNPLSPFTYEIGKAIKIVQKDRDQEFRIRVEEITSLGKENESRAFLEHIKYMLRAPVSRVGIAINELFEIIAVITKLSIFFFQRGRKDVLDFAAMAISDALTEYGSLNGSGVYCALSGLASEIIRTDSQKK